MRSKIILGVIGITVVLTSIAITAMAATGGNYAVWETLLGAKRHGYTRSRPHTTITADMPSKDTNGSCGGWSFT